MLTCVVRVIAEDASDMNILPCITETRIFSVVDRITHD